MLRSTLKSVVHAVKESQDKGQLPQDAYLWGNIVRRMQQAGRATLREQAGKALHAVRARKTDGWRALLTDGRLALEDSLRLARREAEQLEAFRIFERLEGTIHAHRAQAVVMLKYLELEADKLVELEKLLTNEQLAQLRDGRQTVTATPKVTAAEKSATTN